MHISVVIPTCNRKSSLFALLHNLNQSILPPAEVIVVDSGEDAVLPDEISKFDRLNIQYLRSIRAVCVQRNAGIRQAKGDWIFLCDDDIEVPADYLEKLSAEVNKNVNIGAIAGLILQKEKGNWKGSYEVTSTFELFWKFVFQLGIWGEIRCKSNFLSKTLTRIYNKKGNHLSKAGWPVITTFNFEIFETPVYSLGASLVKKDWLLRSPFDESLDEHGIGDNYGVCLGFPNPGVYVSTDAFVYHHQSEINRLARREQYYRRAMALDYFGRTRKSEVSIGTFWLLWSLFGNLLLFIAVWNRMLMQASLRVMVNILLKRNPYVERSRLTQKKVQPVFNGN